MYRKRLLSLGSSLVLALLFAACAPESDQSQPLVTEPEATTGQAPVEPVETAAEPAAAQTPGEVVQAFYDWYLGYIGDRSGGDFRNPVQDGAYQDSPYLSADFVAQVKAAVNGSEGLAYDPFLQAQDIPVTIQVDSTPDSGLEATIVVQRYWGGNPDPSPMTVHLVQQDGRWLIDKVEAVAAADEPVASQPAAAETPEEAARAFYEWYLAYIGDPGSDTFRNPMVDRAYRDSVYLTADFIQEMDELLAGWESEYGGLMHDPFLCAQDIPTEIDVVSVFQNGETANVLISTSFSEHFITLDVQEEDGLWQVADITCANSAVGTTKAFYSWYLGYIGGQDGADRRNPLVDGAYGQSPFLSEAYIAQVEETLASFDKGGFDPILMAQDIPQGFVVEPGQSETEALVTFMFFGEDGQPYGQWRLVVTTEDSFRHPIVAINRAEEEAGEAAGAIFDGAEHGFSFAYPADWVVQEMAMQGPGRPDDWPVVAGWQLMPAEVAEQMAAQSGPPDPSAPPLVAPLQIELLRGDMDALDRAFGPLDGQEQLLAGLPVTILWREPGYRHILIAQPQQTDTWLIISDWVTEFPGREALGEQTAIVLDRLVQSLAFQAPQG